MVGTAASALSRIGLVRARSHIWLVSSNPLIGSEFWRAYMRSRYQILFFVLLVTLILVPLCMAIGLPRWVFRIPIAACLFAAVLPHASRRTRIAIVGTVLVVVTAANM